MSSEEKIRVCREYDYANGVVLNIEDSSSQTVVHAPHTVFPSAFPRVCFNQAYALAVPFQQLYFRVANDFAFLHRCLDDAAQSDSFTANLLKILDSIDRQTAQPIQCAILRSDYMLHAPPGSDVAPVAKQVEINTISASFAGLSARISRLHRHVLRELRPEANWRAVPENRCDEGVVQCMYEAWKAYGQPKSVVVFVVQDRERNKYDQQHLQNLLSERYGVRTVRRSLQQLAKCSELREQPDTKHKLLFVDGVEAAIVYFRAGYGPGDYETDADWATRKKLEDSFAIKIPTVAWQLAGAKKVQQVLAVHDILAKYAPTQDLDLIQKSFAGLYALDEAIVRRAVEKPELYVLKPQREGGGNNLYGEDLKNFLLRAQTSEWPAYILMEMIRSKPFLAEIFRNNALTSGECISELGVYSGLVYDTRAKREIFNEALGHLLRTKLASSNETGVSAGFGSLDSPYFESDM